MAKTRIGISGWRYAPWRGVFYPEDLPQREELHYASRQFNTIEINGSFYSLQNPTNYQRWYDETPRGFVFAVKAPRYITHIHRLKNVEQGLANFFASGVLALREKFGPILWQLPPSFRYDEERLETFFSQLPHDSETLAAVARNHDRTIAKALVKADRKRSIRHAMEVRHTSFVNETFIAQLRRHGVALVVADTAGKWPFLEDVTASFVYMRLHGDKELYASGYTNAALNRWCRHIDAWRRGSEPKDATRCSNTPPRKRAGRDIYCYFDNDTKVKAPFDARKLAEKLG
ncbi:DUF72 domain-containing protein [Dyella sp.]|uniref:DUF72 domain-containing protein n=1 Tax=Dyella sp. TaxID=1869338 RepID=UPI002D78575A|nr:DUF72 domain-containing protein [Dyella sp.]HET7332407.1 DUF72 domain-containing protein [Dyella sp.]